jgi:hypothetical protein
MFVRTLISAVALVTVPIAVIGAEPTPRSQSNESTRKICEIRGETGSRLGAVRVCRTKAERDQAKLEGRRVVERIQNMRPTVCPGPGC